MQADGIFFKEKFYDAIPGEGGHQRRPKRFSGEINLSFFRLRGCFFSGLLYCFTMSNGLGRLASKPVNQ